MWFRRKSKETADKQKMIPKTARWEVGRLCEVYCSNCGCLAPKDDDDEYWCVSICPNCKADMSNGFGGTMYGVV